MFSALLYAVEQGRIIFENIRKFVIYLLSCNISEVLVVFIASVINALAALAALADIVFESRDRCLPGTSPWSR